MRCRVVACLLALLAFASPSFAQLATVPLLPAGQLTLPTGAYGGDPGETGRIYGLVGAVDTLIDYTGQNNYHERLGGLGLAGDIVSRPDLLTSVSFLKSRAEGSQHVGYWDVQTTTDTNVVDGQLTYVTDTKWVLAGAVKLISYSSTSTAKTQVSTGGTVSSSLAYADWTFGGSLGLLTDGLRIGGQVQPAVTATSSNARAGHGVFTLGGVGYTRRRFRVGIEGYQEQENAAAYSAGSGGTILHAEVLLGESFTLAGSYRAYEVDELRASSDFVFTAVEGAASEVTVALQSDAVVWRLRYFALKESDGVAGPINGGVDYYVGGSQEGLEISFVKTL